jgi:hypothetical protein
MFCSLETGDVKFEQLDPSVLENFGINSKKQIDSMLEKFSAGFKRESQA